MLAPILAFAGNANATTATWLGTAGSDFEAVANWSSLPANDLVTDTAVFGTPGAFQPQITRSRSVAGLVFNSPNGGWTLGSNATSNVLTLGTSGITSNLTSGTNVVSAAAALGSNQTWSVTSGGTLLVTGSLSSGSSQNATAPVQLVVGSGTNSGEVVLDPGAGNSIGLYGNLTVGVVQVNQRLRLGSAANSTTSTNTIYNAGSAGLRVASSGSVAVNSGTWRVNDLGSNNSDSFAGNLTISGGTLSTGGARYAGQLNGARGTVITIDGGSFSVTGGGNTVVNTGFLGLGTYATANSTGTVQMNVSAGTVDVAKAAGTLPGGVSSAAIVLGGVGNTSVLVNQTGGLVRAGVASGSNVFSGVTNSNTFTNLSIGSNATANQCAYTLAGGTLLVAGNVQGVTSPGGVSNFNFIGGTLSAAGVTTGALGSSPNATATSNQLASSVGIGTLTNRGGTLAPGGVGTAGRTVVTGNYSIASGTLAIDLGGTTQATAFQTGQYDFLSVTGNVTLGGNLSVNVLSGFTPTANQTFTVLNAAAISGNFSNVPFGQRVVSTNGLATFVVTGNTTAVTLGSYRAVTAPTITAASAPAEILPGDTVVLGVTTDSLAPVTYEWRRNGALIDGATSASLTLSSVQPENSGNYEVTVRNAAGTTTRTFNVVVTVPPSTTRIVLDAGGNRTFTANPGAVSYRWNLDGEDVGTSSSFVYSPARKAVGGHWLRVIETYSGNTTVTRNWYIRVRIPIPTSTAMLYVSPTGSDAGNGSLGAPFATLERARDAIRAMSKPLPAGGVTVYLRGGIHRRTSTFTLNATDSGTETAPVIYAAFPGETPILTTSRPIASSQISQLAVSEQSRLPAGTNAAQVWEIDVSGSTSAGAPPGVFNEWIIFNALRSSQNSGLLEVFQDGERLRISRYPNANLTNDTLTQSLTMNGVAPGNATDGTGYLNGAGTYTLGDGSTTQVGGAFQYNTADAARIARWQTSVNSGGVWLGGYWRVPWQINYARVKVIDPAKQTIGFVTNSSNASAALISNGIGDKYTRPVGSKKEPWWAFNLLEELDQVGEWCIDFNRKRLCVFTGNSTVPADGSIEISDNRNPLIQVNSGSDIIFQGLTFQRHLGIAIQVLGGNRTLVAGSTFRQIGNVAVDINGGTNSGVISSSFEKLAAGGVMLRGGALSPAMVSADHFAVNNRFRSFSEVVRVYQAAVDLGFGGPLGSWGQPTVGMRAAHNDVRTSPHAGILWAGYQNVIEYNEISDFTRISADLGAIYRYGPNIDSGTIIRFNHAYASPQGEGIYNDADHVRTPIYGNVVNLKTPTTASRGYGFWTTTNTIAGASVPGLPMQLNMFNNIAVNGRSNYYFHSQPGGVIQNNVSYRALSTALNWRLITVNTSTNTATVSTSNATVLASGPNIDYATDPGFVDFANDDLRLRPDSRIYTDMPGFTPIPLEMSGLDNDEYRTEARVWTPFVVTGNAANIGANTATFTGNLVYPLFDGSATVRVYWGTTDGGNDPAAWQNVAVLGQPGSGSLRHVRSDLAPGTRYFFRFHAVNSAGEHWAEQTNSTTTYPILQVAAGGNASATSAAQPPSNAFDGNLTSVWQTAPGVTTATLTYEVPGGGTALVTRYDVVSAPDSPARDPRDWRFEASADGVGWVVLDTRTGETFSARSQVRTFGFASNSEYRFYRLVITANNGDTSSLQLGELRLFYPDLAPDTAPPVITTPGNMTVAGTSSAGAYVFFEVSAVDAVSGNVPATATPVSGSLFPVGNTTVTVTARDAAGNTANSTFVVTVTAPQLAAPWTIRQIQQFPNTTAGNATLLTATSFQINGRGGNVTGGTTGDIWTGNNDSFTFVSQPWTGDGIFTARLSSFNATDSSAKAGIMFRESSVTGSRYSAVYMLRKGDAWSQHKTALSGSTTNVNFFTASATGKGIPEWLRLVRQGNTFTTFTSEDGITWTQLGTARANTMEGSSISVGFAVAPRTGNQTATAVFDNISFVTPLQNWRQTYFGTTLDTGNAANSADPDADGLPNLLEYAFGTSPVSFTSQAALAPAVYENRLAISFDRIADPSLVYSVEAASNLAPADWTEIWQSTGLENVPGTVTILDTQDLSLSPRRFLRVRVTAP